MVTPIERLISVTLTAKYLPADNSTLPPFALIHGFDSSAKEDFIANGFAEKRNAAGRTVIAIDLPAHGENEALTDDAAAKTSAVIQAILDTVSKHYPEGEFDVIGYSLGGRLTWDLPAASDRVRK